MLRRFHYLMCCKIITLSQDVYRKHVYLLVLKIDRLSTLSRLGYGLAFGVAYLWKNTIILWHEVTSQTIQTDAILVNRR